METVTDWKPLPLCPDGSQYLNTGGSFGDWQCPSVLKHQICHEIINSAYQISSLQYGVHDCFYDLGCQPRYPTYFIESCENTGVPSTPSPTAPWIPLDICSDGFQYLFDGNMIGDPAFWICQTTTDHDRCMTAIGHGEDQWHTTNSVILQMAVHECFYIFGSIDHLSQSTYKTHLSQTRTTIGLFQSLMSFMIP